MSTALISVNELRSLMDARDGALVVLDARFDLQNPAWGEAQYEVGHIPGAQYVHLDRDLSDKSQTLAGRHPLPSATQFENLMQRLGVSPDSLIVVADQGDFSTAARVWWLCRYYGHAQVRVLDGGYQAWGSQGEPVSVDTRTGVRGSFRAQGHTDMTVNHALLESGTLTGHLIDSRDAARFEGRIEPIDPVAGHIPGAVNAPWKLCLNEQGLMKNAKQLREQWAWLAEKPGKPVLYCGSGVTACVNLLALEVAGFEGARLFPGSWSEWCQRGGPVAVGPASGA